MLRSRLPGALPPQVEDDVTIGRHLETGLRGNGYTPIWSRTVSPLWPRPRAPYDVLLLDLALPDIDGLDVARARHPDLLIVILTARTDDIDVIAGLDAGADYLGKPFSLTVLFARHRAHLRRQVVAAPAQEPVRLADHVIDVVARRCTLHDQHIELRPKKFDLLAVLARHAGEADENRCESTKTLDVTMAGLRRRLTEAANTSAHPSTLPRVTTLRGHGYRLGL